MLPGLPAGEQPLVEKCAVTPIVADTFAGRIHVEWDGSAAVTPLGQLPFFIEYLKQGGLFDGWVAGCPMHSERAKQARRSWDGASVCESF